MLKRMISGIIKVRRFVDWENEQQAIDCFIKATIGSSEPQQAFFYNDQQPDKIFYQGLAWRALGREDKACGCFNKLIKHGEKHFI